MRRSSRNTITRRAAEISNSDASQETPPRGVEMPVSRLAISVNFIGALLLPTFPTTPADAPARSSPAGPSRAIRRSVGIVSRAAAPRDRNRSAQFVGADLERPRQIDRGGCRRKARVVFVVGDGPPCGLGRLGQLHLRQSARPAKFRETRPKARIFLFSSRHTHPRLYRRLLAPARLPFAVVFHSAVI